MEYILWTAPGQVVATDKKEIIGAALTKGEILKARPSNFPKFFKNNLLPVDTARGLTVNRVKRLAARTSVIFSLNN